jgi:peptidoglycan/LPS O-acetylase OafA/YrhL
MPERINGGQALVAIGAIALIVSLFVSWYEPGRSAWTVFEVWDIVLAAIGIAALTAIVPARRTDVRDERIVPERWLPALAGAALVIVVVSLINHPPAARGGSPEVGAWLALAAAIVLSAGAILSRARVSLIITLRASERTRGAPSPPPPLEPEPPEPEGDFEAETATQPLPPSSRP